MTGTCESEQPITAESKRSQLYGREVLVSPDGAHSAVVQAGADRWFLDGRSFFEVWLGRNSPTHRHHVLALSSSGGGADVSWGRSNHLLIEYGRSRGPTTVPPNTPSRPHLLRQVGSVQLRYRAVGELTEQSYRESLQKYEQLQRDRLTDSETERTPAQDWRWVQELWERYVTFRDWLPEDDGPGQTPPLLSRHFDLDASFPSPDASHVATLSTSHETEQPSGTASYSVSIAVSGGQQAAELAFYALDGRPKLSWDGPRTLVVTIAYVSRVRTSLHRAGDITVEYRLADAMQEESFRASLDKERRYVEQNQSPALPPTPERQAALGARLDRGTQRQLDHYSEFSDWAKENAKNWAR